MGIRRAGHTYHCCKVEKALIGWWIYPNDTWPFLRLNRNAKLRRVF